MGGPKVKAPGLKTKPNQAFGAWFSSFLEKKRNKKRKNKWDRGGKDSFKWPKREGKGGIEGGQMGER